VLLPDEVRKRLQRAWPERRRRELAGDAEWPFRVVLGAPTEAEAAGAVDTFRDWTAAWERWTPPGEVHWEERSWSRLGRQRIPRRLVVGSAERLAELVGSGHEWRGLRARREVVRRELPASIGGRVFAAWHEHVGALSESDFRRLVSVVLWLSVPRGRAVHLRTLPIAGIDTKWIEANEAVVREWVAAARGLDPAIGTAAVCELWEVPPKLRVRLLAPELRAVVGGLRDLEAPVEQLAALALRPRGVLVVENLASAQALGDLPGVVVVAGLGASVTLVSRLDWARGVPWGYWGDLDTHGFAILDRARAVDAEIQSLLMDTGTLLAHRDLWGTEPSQHTAGLTHLTPPEREVYEGLRSHRWGDRVRLEQERIDWNRATAAIDSWSSSL
jgi:hypothetical protein